MADGTEVGTAYVSITPSAAGFGAKLQQQITGEAGQAGQKAGQALGTGLTGQASSIAKSVGGIFAVVGAARFFKGSIAEAEDAARVGRLSEAVIKSTGGTAGVTAAQVEKLAGSLSKMAAVDDEVIQGAANVLLTFTQVKNQVGAGNDVFNQATAAALDMSAALGGDLQGAVIQLGKALNDPVAGMTALTRSGVSFTEQQKDQIKALQKSGDLLGAQKIILGEVSREFGGAAAANATATAKFGVAVGNLGESIGTVLLPAVNAGAGGLEHLVGVFTDLPGPAQGVASALFVVTGGIAATSLAVGLLGPKIRLAKAELQGLGLAGRAAGTGLAVAGRAMGLAGLALGLNELGGAIRQALVGTTSVGKLGESITAFAKQGVADGELLKRFGGDIDSIAGSLAGIKYGRHSGFLGEHFDTFARGLTGHSEDFVKAKERIGALDDTLAAMVTGGNAAGAKTFVEQLTVALQAQGANVPEIIGSLDDYRVAVTNTEGPTAAAGNAVEITAEQIAAADAKIASAAKTWDDLHGKLEGLVATDWSKTLAGNLTSAVNPLEKFTFSTGKNIGDLKTQLAGTKADLDKAVGDLAKLAGTGTSADIANIRGQAGDIDAARAAVAEATGRFNDTKKQLAEAQKSPLSSITENLQTNLTGLTKWLTNIETLTKGGHQSLAQHLASLGPQAADALAEAVGVSPKQLDHIEGLFDKADVKIAEAASGQFELNLDQVGKPGQTLAEIITARYEKSLVPGFTKATLAALNKATAAILGGEEGKGISFDVAGEPGPGEPRRPPALVQGIGPVVPPIVAPLAPPPASLINVPGFTMPVGGGGGVTFGDINVTSTADPREIAGEVGDAVAWRLAPRPTLVG